MTEVKIRESEPLVKQSSSTEFSERSYGEKWITSVDGAVYGKIVTTQAPPPTSETCWHCGSAEQPEDIFKPCNCASSIHRMCFRKWRTGWINPKNYFSCMFSYNIERVKPPTTESIERIRRNYRISVAKVWLSVLLAGIVIVGSISGISYGSDTSDKNIPVAMRYILTSVVGGFPNSNSTAEWRESFKEPNVKVWPYYSMFGIFVTSVLILFAFACLGCTFDERDRRRAGHCNCCDDCCRGGGNGALYAWYAPTPTRCDCVFDCNSCGMAGSNCNLCGGGGGGSGGGCDGDLAPVLAVIVVVIVVIIIFSALLVSVLFTIQKCSLLYDRVTAMIDSQQSELEGETVVLGIHESWRPNNAV